MRKQITWWENVEGSDTLEIKYIEESGKHWGARATGRARHPEEKPKETIKERKVQDDN